AVGKELDEEQLAFLADLRVAYGQVAQPITHNAAFQTDDLDAYDSDCDDFSSTKRNIIPYSQYLEETRLAIVQNTNTFTQQNFMILSMFEQMSNHATNWDKANNENKIVNESLTAELERYKERVKILKQRFNVDLSGREKFIDSQMDDMIRMKNTKFAAFETEIDTLKQAFSKHVKEKLLTTLNGFQTEFKERESKSIDKEIVLENKNKELENIVLENADLKTQIQEKVFANATLQNELRKLKGKNVIDNVVSKPHATTIAPGMFKLDLEPLALKVLKNKDTHLEYIKHSREHAEILREIAERARALSPLDSNLDLACKYVQRIQEVLVYIRDTCLCLTRPSEILVVVTPKNKDKKVRFADPVTSSSNTQKHVDSHKPKDYNPPFLHSTGVISSTGASGSKPTSNTKNNRISQSSSSNKTNKVEDQSRSVKSRKNKKNRVSKIKCNAYVMQSMLNANSKSVCAICNECLFDANHNKCVLDYVYDVNVLFNSNLAKRKYKKHIWKPTGKVYIKIGYKWKPTRRTFTIVRNKCPLTRFTSTKVVPLKEITTKSVVTPTQGIMVYSRRPKAPRSVGERYEGVEVNKSG
ncbi:hypothetical protein Tco_0936464, partial [Tanacetum coccineum]